MCDKQNAQRLLAFTLGTQALELGFAMLAQSDLSSLEQLNKADVDMILKNCNIKIFLKSELQPGPVPQ
jgi:hypothetical protein